MTTENRAVRTQIISRLSVDADICEMAFLDALVEIDPNRIGFFTTIIAAPGQHKAAEEVAQRFGALVVLAPEGVFASRDHWLLVTHEGAVWSGSG